MYYICENATIECRKLCDLSKRHSHNNTENDDTFHGKSHCIFKGKNVQCIKYKYNFFQQHELQHG